MPLAFPKPTPHILAKRATRAAQNAEDRRQRKLCHLRSGSRCEVIIAHFRPERSSLTYERCRKRATQNHHLIGGRGRRNVGQSILAQHRLDTCSECHQLINAGLLIPLFRDPHYAHQAALVRFERVGR
jgi:hypothetical protein